MKHIKIKILKDSTNGNIKKKLRGNRAMRGTIEFSSGNGSLSRNC